MYVLMWLCVLLLLSDEEATADGTVLTTVDSRDHLNVVFIGHVGALSGAHLRLPRDSRSVCASLWLLLSDSVDVPVIVSRTPVGGAAVSTCVSRCVPSCVRVCVDVCGLLSSMRILRVFPSLLCMTPVTVH